MNLLSKPRTKLIFNDLHSYMQWAAQNSTIHHRVLVDMETNKHYVSFN